MHTTDENEICRLFSNLEPFRQLSCDQLASICRNCRKITLPAGESIIAQGQRAAHVGVIQHGRAKVALADLLGTELLCGHLKSGDLVFDISVLTGTGALCSVVSLETTVMYRQPQEAFLTAIEAHRPLKEFFYRNTVLGVWWGHEIVNKGFAPGLTDRRHLGRRLPFLHKALQYIHLNYSQPITLEMVAKETAMSKFHFSRLFKQHMGLSFKQYLNRQRVEAAKSLIVNQGCNITEASFAVGFNDASYFSRVFRELEGRSPRRLLVNSELPFADENR